MFQKFYIDTLGSRYIKSLLAQTPIPLYDSVVDGDYLISGCYYVYESFIINCVSSGILRVKETEVLYPSDKLYPSVFLYPESGYQQATFRVVSHAHTYNRKTHSAFKSSTNYYDSETHYQLSRYIRYLYTTTGLNLFPFYNCYNSTYFSDVELSVDRQQNVLINRVNKANHKVVAVPILFGHTYTIAVDCPTQVLMRACIHDNSGFTPEKELPVVKTEDLATKTIQQVLEQSGKIYSYARFKSPVTFRVETSSLSSLMLQHNLYLLIQLPLNNDSSIVVLENYDDRTGIRCDENNVRQPSLTNPSLLVMNTRQSYAFSDRLIEYLVGNVIYEGDNIAENVAYAQTILSQYSPEYKKSFITGKNRKGIWDNNITSLIQSLIDNSHEGHMLYDQDGNLNKEIELLIHSSKGGK